MSDKDYMNDKQLEFFRNRLTEMEAELRHNAGQTTENLRESTVVPDPADRATIEEEHALELRTRDRERKLLKMVQAAIKRIDEGEYGYCEETGEPIGVRRLLARPTATLSLEAQERREIKQKMFGDRYVDVWCGFLASRPEEVLGLEPLCNFLLTSTAQKHVRGRLKPSFFVRTSRIFEVIWTDTKRILWNSFTERP